MPSHDEPSAEELERARQHTRVPVDPLALGQPDGRHQRVNHSSEEISRSYALQGYFIDLDGVRQLLVPDREASDLTDDAREYHLLTAWNPAGRRSTFRENDSAQCRLRARLGEHVVGRGVAVPPDHTWFEEVLVVDGLNDGQAIEVGLEFDQPAVVAWAAGQLRVIATSALSVVDPVDFSARLELASGSCPIRDDLDPVGRCVSRGGPWVSASIHAHALWSDHRALGVRLLGCERCVDGRLPAWDGPGGSSIALSSVCIGSRYGGASWRP